MIILILYYSINSYFGSMQHVEHEIYIIYMQFGNTENKQAEKGSWLKQVGKISRVEEEEVKSDRQSVGAQYP